MGEKQHSDKVIREKFESFSVEPSAHIWNDISASLIARKKKKRMAYISWISAAAVVLFAFMAGWFVKEQSQQLHPELTEEVIQHQDSTTPTETPDLDADSVLLAYKPEVDPFKKEPAEKVIDTPINWLAENESDWREESMINVETERESFAAFTLLSAKKGYVAGSKSDDLFALEELGGSLREQELSLNDQLLIAENRKILQAEKQGKHDWVIGAHLSPGYAAHTSSYSSAYVQDMGTNRKGGVRNTGGGLSVQLKTSEKISIESGVYYAQNSQSNGSGNRLFNMSLDFANLPDNEYNAGSDQVYANSVELRTDGLLMNSAAGVVKMLQTPAGSEFTAANVADDKVNQAILYTSGNFSQDFDFIEIPVYLRYHLIDKKIGVDMLGGVNAGIVIGNKVYYSNEQGRQNIGTTEDISAVNLSGTFGVGISYALGKHFSLSVEPRINYYLNSINTNPEIDYRPYRFGLFTGVYYQF